MDRHAEERLVRLYRQASLVVERHYAKPLTVAAVARVLASSPRQVQRAYASVGATTFREALRTRRMNAAAQLLAQRAIPIADVARLVGYRQHSHFSRVFRRSYHVAPAAFRAELIGGTAARGVILRADDGPPRHTHPPHGARTDRGRIGR
ncbi:MAG: helix-turn-helix transcriptional regulator [Acidobacteriota bacterium]|nr:helix-turn-helix transcriptional regulator [Acidobacteriota bacterium]